MSEKVDRTTEEYKRRFEETKTRLAKEFSYTSVKDDVTPEMMDELVHRSVVRQVTSAPDLSLQSR